VDISTSPIYPFGGLSRYAQSDADLDEFRSR
jgi:hypothetical protein